MNARDHHDAAIEQLGQARKMMDHVLKALADANSHLAAAPKVSGDANTSHMSAYLSGLVTMTLGNADHLQKQIGKCSAYTVTIRDGGELP